MREMILYTFALQAVKTEHNIALCSDGRGAPGGSPLRALGYADVVTEEKVLLAPKDQGDCRGARLQVARRREIAAELAVVFVARVAAAIVARAPLVALPTVETHGESTGRT